MSRWGRFSVFFLFCLGFAVVTSAQTIVTVGPVNSASLALWDYGAGLTLEKVRTFEPRFRIDGAGPFSPQGWTCVPSTPPTPEPWTCEVLVTAPMIAALNVPGSHSVTLRLYDPATSLEGEDSVPFVLRSPPGVARDLRFIL